MPTAPIDPRPESKAATVRTDAAICAAWALLLAACFAAPLLSGDANPGDAFTRNTARLTVACYGLAAMLMTFLRGDEWQAKSGRGRFARWCWVLGVAAYWVHVATAYHFVHHWSHESALRHTREVSGVAEGIYISDSFGLVWLLDAAWWLGRPRGYARRPAWVGGIVHVFMAFVVFNGTVVYESGPIRWPGAALFLVLAALLLRRAVLGRRTRTAVESNRSAPA
jgi:hypothetical protein